MTDDMKMKIGNYRWVICALLFFATTINYMDRQVISYLKPFYCKSVESGGFGWTNTDFSYLTAFFTAFYAGMTIGAGRLIDKIGTKLGLAWSLIVWSFAGIANAFAGATIAVHVFIRSIFAVGEAGNFPASNKTVAEWFPKKERALAFGIFNSGSNMGAMIAALLMPWIMVTYGDQAGWNGENTVPVVQGFQKRSAVAGRNSPWSMAVFPSRTMAKMAPRASAVFSCRRGHLQRPGRRPGHDPGKGILPRRKGSSVSRKRKFLSLSMDCCAWCRPSKVKFKCRR